MLLDRSGCSQGQSLARPHPSGRLQSALPNDPQPRHQLYRLVPVDQHDLTGLGVAAAGVRSALVCVLVCVCLFVGMFVCCCGCVVAMLL